MIDSKKGDDVFVTNGEQIGVREVFSSGSKFVTLYDNGFLWAFSKKTGFRKRGFSYSKDLIIIDPSKSSMSLKCYNEQESLLKEEQKIAQSLMKVYKDIYNLTMIEVK